VVCQAGLYPFIYQGLRCTVLTQTLPIMPAPQPNMMAKLDVPHGYAVQFVFTSTAGACVFLQSAKIPASSPWCHRTKDVQTNR
jgi:hypothetical protein